MKKILLLGTGGTIAGSSTIVKLKILRKPA